MSLSSRFARMTPFSRHGVENEDLGENLDSASVAGGGHASRRSEITKSQLRVSTALTEYLAKKGMLSQEDVDTDSEHPTAAVQALMDKPHIDVPAQLTDRSHPLPEYFISSSHNTYLMAHQLFGASSAAAYELALSTGSRCVEIDAWDNDENPQEPKVTHGYTLVSHISFRAVCGAIRDVVDKEAAQSVNEQGYRSSPIILSLENHCGAEGQLRLVQIMAEVWGDRLLSQAIRRKGHEEQDGAEGANQHVSLDELGSKIVVIVEYPLPDEVDDGDDDESGASEGEDEKAARQEYIKKKKAVASGVIVPELAAIGVYAQSVKPRDNSWFESAQLKNGPHHHLINVSEIGLRAHMPAQSENIARHNAQHLMRVFPKGTRISSKNLNPIPFWGIGAQFVNQTYKSRIIFHCPLTVISLVDAHSGCICDSTRDDSKSSRGNQYD
jgi:phosphatidylinositol phospholipase C delta